MLLTLADAVQHVADFVRNVQHVAGHPVVCAGCCFCALRGLQPDYISNTRRQLKHRLANLLFVTDCSLNGSPGLTQGTYQHGRIDCYISRTCADLPWGPFLFPTFSLYVEWESVSALRALLRNCKKYVLETLRNSSPPCFADVTLVETSFCRASQYVQIPPDEAQRRSLSRACSEIFAPDVARVHFLTQQHRAAQPQ